MAKHTDRRESKATFVESRKDRIIYRMVNKASRKRCLKFGSYFVVLVVGVVIGLVPFVLQYISDIKADRDTLRLFVQQQEKLYNLTAKHPSAMALSTKSKKLIRKKTGSAQGNESIDLSCGGKIGIAAVRLNEVAASENAIKKFSDYCKQNMKIVDNMNTCFVSMEKVYKFKIANQRSFTEIEYTCEESF